MPRTQIHGTQIQDRTVNNTVFMPESIDGYEIKPGAINNDHISDGIEAKKIVINDVSNKFISTTVEEVLSEIDNKILEINNLIGDGTVSDESLNNLNQTISTRIDNEVNTLNTTISNNKLELDNKIDILQSDDELLLSQISDINNSKAKKEGDNLQDFQTNNLTISGNILPKNNGTQDIGSATNRFRGLYVDEAYLSTNTLYIGDTPVLGTDQDTIMVKADLDQSITVKTSGTGQSKMISQNGVEISTSGMNADVKVQATGVGSRAVLSANKEVSFVAPDIKISGNTDITGSTFLNDLTVKGNLNVKGTVFTVDSTTVQVADNIIELNKGQVGNGVTAGQAGLRIDRGDAPDYLMIFDETDDIFKVGMTGQLETVATQNWVQSNIYKHPETHSANIITEELDRKFMTNDEKNKLANTKQTIVGSSNFVGSKDVTGYKEINLGTTMSNTNYVISITPTSPTNGDLGEYYVVKSLNNFKVYNTGIHTGDFDYMILY